MSLFAGTAGYYQRFRSDVPNSVAEVLDAAVQGDRRPRRLLDVGTGTGFVIRALISRFDDIIGIDVDTDLLAVAESELRPLAADVRLELFQAAAESFQPPAAWSADLVTVCRTFHWLDRPAFLTHVDPHITPDGVLAVFGDNSIWARNSPWKVEVQAVIAEFLGEQRRAGSGTYRRPDRGYIEELQDSPFSQVTRTVIPVSRERNLDSVIGYLHSTSFAAPALFGDRLRDFDDTLRRRLPTYATNGVFIDDNRFEILIARRR